MPTHVVIIGGGFAGVACASELLRAQKRGRISITLFSQENHLVFSPLLADCVGSSLNPSDVMAPLRQMLPGVDCRSEAVSEIDLASKRVFFHSQHLGTGSLSYDHLVIASGNIANLGAVTGMVDHAFPLKSVGDADELRSHILQQLELADVCDDPEERRWRLSFIVVGGGYSGVESAGEINDLVRSSRRFYRRIRQEEISVQLVHSREQILPEISPSLREFAQRKMEKAGVTMVLKARARMVTARGVGLDDGRFLQGATVVCTIGTSPAPFVEKLQAPKDKGRLQAQADLRLQGSSDVWLCGDCAIIPNTYDGQPSPPTGQFAQRQGRHAAINIQRLLDGQPTLPFSFKPLGQLCSIGGHTAVAEFLGMRLSGFIAWFIWRGVYLFKLPTWSGRVKVGFDWFWLLFFPRDLAYRRIHSTERVAHAHYENGDWIFHQGTAADGFYVIDKGEVEIIDESYSPPRIIAVLGPGNFFGEQALLTDKPRGKGVRARGSVDAVIMGIGVFRRVTGALTPLRQAIAQANERRNGKMLLSQADPDYTIDALQLSRVLSPPPSCVPPQLPLHAAARELETADIDILYVTDPKSGRLLGLVTLSDLVKAHASGHQGSDEISSFMHQNPVSICLQDSTLTAFNVLREHQIKSLPVLDAEGRPVGCVRAKRLLGLLIGEQSSFSH